jgi:hypothetical protein
VYEHRPGDCFREARFPTSIAQHTDNNLCRINQQGRRGQAWNFFCMNGAASKTNYAPLSSGFLLFFPA